MASFFKKLGGLFGIGRGGREKPKEYTGEKPYRSLTETPQGSLYWKTLQDRLAGLGVGPEESLIDIDKTTAPFAAARREGFTRYEKPMIASEASARGLGRSTIPVSRMAISGQEAERDIEQRIADLQVKNVTIQQANEMQRRAEISDALTKLGIFTGAEAGQQGARTAFDYGDYGRVEGEKEKRYASSMEGIKNLVSLAATAIGGAVGGPVGTMVGSQVSKTVTGRGGTSDTASIIDEILKKRNAAMVNK